MKNVNQIVGKEIRRRRKKLGLSGIELADLIGVSQQQISRYERGECNITLGNLLNLAKALETDLICFFNDDIFLIEKYSESKKTAENKSNTMKYRMVNHYL
ncbi:helix-turn-helix transcriptional regulator [Providencia stuartii]|uniref:Transcriptional regulator n=2 Tax=Providencia TaxID=586 RepID=A0A1S1HYS2_PROST|nr:MULTISPECIES: helix-turn-helix transcriptional regulator [Providencia]MDV5226136.1 helix-turn-helix transcriptional regulator [Providencia rettgeri]ELR5040810.1 helix-turn-helix transcriptional regulator [Providencia stuartii]ELR5083615.1 helix-turn-helix transcriptional regulator [Providencia stuartii]ELR5112326.1 helix-turn-helix transcriptional regulator [Providencia stuartii]ELR5302069.1 helix-turn-helix transcriptional regulator [Providencia stuartii]